MICIPIVQSKRQNKYIVTHFVRGGNCVRMDMGMFLSNEIVWWCLLVKHNSILYISLLLSINLYLSESFFPHFIVY